MSWWLFLEVCRRAKWVADGEPVFVNFLQSTDLFLRFVCRSESEFERIATFFGSVKVRVGR